MWTENGALKSEGPEVIIMTLQKIKLTKLQDIVIGVGISNALCDLLVKRAKKGQKPLTIDLSLSFIHLADAFIQSDCDCPHE